MTGRWGCLMYHEVMPAGAALPYFAVSAATFHEQIRSLAGFGLRGVSLETALERPEGIAAITFDDGHETHYHQAFPILAELSATATFFVTTRWVGTRGYATWAQLREMAEAGMSIQSHTASHPFFSELSRADVERQLIESREAIESNVGRPCTTIALPGGDAPREWRPEDFARVGYRCVATSEWGPNLPPAREPVSHVRRYTVRRDTTVETFSRQARALDARFSTEGLRLSLLRTARRTIGASRYARWRRRALTLLNRGTDRPPA